MSEEKAPVSEAQVVRLGSGAFPHNMFGPLMVDQAVRQAISHCWMVLPEEERSPARVEQEILRLVHRALQEMWEDAAAFGFPTESKDKEKQRMEQIRVQHPKAYQKWTDEDDNLLLQKYEEGVGIADLAGLFQRQPSAIRARLAKLGLT